jgi:hypothetical protein
MILFIALGGVVLIALLTWLWIERRNQEPQSGAEYKPPGVPPPIE